MLHPELRLERREDAEKIKRYIRDQELLGDPQDVRGPRARRDAPAGARARAPRLGGSRVVASVPPKGAEPWTEDRLQIAMAPFFAEHAELDFSARARSADLTRIDVVEPRVWRVRQTLVDPEGDNLLEPRGHHRSAARQELSRARCSSSSGSGPEIARGSPAPRAARRRRDSWRAGSIADTIRAVTAKTAFEEVVEVAMHLVVRRLRSASCSRFSCVVPRRPAAEKAGRRVPGQLLHLERTDPPRRRDRRRR